MEIAAVTIKTQTVANADAKKYQALIDIERLKGSDIRPKKVLVWNFGDRSGELLLATVKEKQAQSCVVYLKSRERYISLGGNEYCRWIENPKLVWHGQKAWVEFPQLIKQPKNYEKSIYELTVHFDKSTGDICVLGLPAQGYDAIRCADDEAPLSK